MKKKLPRWLQQAAKRKDDRPAPDGMNRAAFRAGGLQGRRDSVSAITKGGQGVEWRGRKRGGFLTKGGRASMLLSHNRSRKEESPDA